MNTRYLYGTNITRLARNIARKRFDAGETIIIVPAKMWPGSYRGIGMKLNADDLNERYYGQSFTFDSLVNDFTFANCNYEVGYYPAFYIIKGE